MTRGGGQPFGSIELASTVGSCSVDGSGSVVSEVHPANTTASNESVTAMERMESLLVVSLRRRKPAHLGEQRGTTQ